MAVVHHESASVHIHFEKPHVGHSGEHEREEREKERESEREHRESPPTIGIVYDPERDSSVKAIVHETEEKAKKLDDDDNPLSGLVPKKDKDHSGNVPGAPGTNEACWPRKSEEQPVAMVPIGQNQRTHDYGPIPNNYGDVPRNEGEYGAFTDEMRKGADEKRRDEDKAKKAAEKSKKDKKGVSKCTWLCIGLFTGSVALTLILLFAVFKVHEGEDDDGNGNANGSKGPGDLRKNGQPGSPVTVDIASAGEKLDASTLAFVGASTDPTGVWTLDTAAGTATFTPTDKAPAPASLTNPKPVNYQIKSSDDADTFTGTVTVVYTTGVDPGHLTEPTPPAAKGADVVFKPAGDPTKTFLDPKSIKIFGLDGNTFGTREQGSWTVDPDKGTITFSPDDALNFNPDPVTYQVTSTDGRATFVNTLSAVYSALTTIDRPKTNQIIVAGHPGTTTPTVIDIVKDGGFVKGTNGLGKIEIEGLYPEAPDAMRHAAGAKLSDDGLTLTVPQEGTWVIDNTAKTITFTPTSGTVDAPTPIQFTVSDDKGALSLDSAIIIVSKTAYDLEQGVLSTSKMDDTTFWAKFNSGVVNVPSSDATLEDMLAVTHAVWRDTRRSLDHESGSKALRLALDAAEGDDGKKLRQTTTEVDAIFNAWRVAHPHGDQAAKADLMTRVNKAIVGIEQFTDPATNNKVTLDSVKLATRYLRISLLRRLLLAWVDDQAEIAKKTVKFHFEQDASKGWVGALQDSDLVNGKIATQNAGSSNKGDLYYQVGGLGMNGIFATALTASNQLGTVNASLQVAYNSLDATSKWATDKATPPAKRSTGSLIVGLAGDGTNVGDDVSAMVYSVGPVLDASGITNEDDYQQIYFNAVERIATWNLTNPEITALRVTMLSTGIYADSVTDKDKLFETAAKNIILGLARGIATYGLSDLTILINTNDTTSPADHNGNPHDPRERKSFTKAAHDLFDTSAKKFAVTNEGFTVELWNVPDPKMNP